MELLIFGIFALIAVACSLGVIFARHPVHCAIFLLGALFAVAALFAVLWAEFLAVVQLLVYAGGIMVLFLFVIMLVDLEQRGLTEEAGRIGHRIGKVHRWIWGGTAIVLSSAIGWLLSSSVPVRIIEKDAVTQALQGPFSGHGLAMGNTEWIGQLLYRSSYLLPFELASVLLLVAMIGAVVIARRDA